MNPFSTEHPLTAQRMTLRARIIFLGMCAFIVLAAVFGFLHLNGPRVVGRAVAPDGTEMRLVQECNWNAELFTTSFYYRKPNGPWGWFYYDHQDDYWGNSRVDLDTNAGRAVFYRGKVPAMTFEWATETYTLHRWNRTLTGAQTKLPANWEPGQ